jgi:hypothetical protein
MSEIEKQRALTLVTVVTLGLVGLLAYQSQHQPTTAAGLRDSLELCAVSKGAICDEFH